MSDLLLVAQIESGKLTLEPEDVDLADLATHSVEALRPAADARDIDLRLDAHPVPNMTGDPARLGQLLDNLVSNAVKFTEDGGRVVVALGVRGDDLVLAVSDNGIGIPVAEQRRLFDRFFRATTAQDRAIEGTGLGLTIVRAIVQRPRRRDRGDERRGPGHDLPGAASGRRAHRRAGRFTRPLGPDRDLG